MPDLDTVRDALTVAATAEQTAQVLNFIKDGLKEP